MKTFLLILVAINGVVCTPGIPHAEYGNVGEFNLAEKALPFNKIQPVSFESETITEDLPGTRNLDEKSIPDSITLKRIPDPSRHLELPWYPYNGGFVVHAGQHQQLPYNNENEHPSSQQELYGDIQLPIYPNPTPDEKTGLEIKETELNPSSNTPQISIGQVELPTPSGDRDPIKLAPDSSIKVQDGHGQYSHGFSSPDGTQVQESGHLISTDDGWEYVIAKEGSYRYVSPEGIPISVRYIADENGFRILN